MIQNQLLSLQVRRAIALACLICVGVASAMAQTRLTVSGTTVTPAKVYDGTTLSAATMGVVTGIASGHDVVVTAAASYLDETADTSKAVVVTYSLSGTDAELYLAPVDDTLRADITPLMLSVTDAQLAEKVYNQGGDTYFAFQGNLVGVLPIDDSCVFHSAAAHYLDVNAGDLRPVAVTYLLHGSRSANYQIVQNDTLYGTILPRPAYVSGATTSMNKIYDGTTAINVTSQGAIDLGNIYPGDSLGYTSEAYFLTPNVAMLKAVRFVHTPFGPASNNYQLLDTMLHVASISARQLEVTTPEVQLVKEADGTDTAIVVTPAYALNLVEGDTATLFTSAFYGSDTVGDHQPITVHYALVGAQAPNYSVPSDYLYSSEGRIILPTILDTMGGESQYFVASAADGYCQGIVARYSYRLLQGEPLAYRVTFSDEALAAGFAATGWVDIDSTNLGSVTFPIPAECPDGSFTLYIQFVNAAHVTTASYETAVKVNLTNNYLLQVFDDVVSIDNSGTLDGIPNRFSTYKWYHDGQLISESKPYHQEIGGLTGTYAVLVNEGTPQQGYVCPKTFSNVSLPAAVYVYPSPVERVANVKLQGFAEGDHLLQLFNGYGTLVHSFSFHGVQCSLDMSAFPQGVYMINVDGHTAKTIKL